MIIDARQLDPGSRLDADLCIVGTGPAGISLAREFLGTGVRVVMLEAGGLVESTESQDFYAGQNVGFGYSLQGSRYRMFGGSSAHWGGYTAPLNPADLEPHPTIPLSGWPIGWNDLRPYYPRAARILGFADHEFELSHWTDRGHVAVDFPEGTVRNKIWRFHRLRFGEAFREPLDHADHVRVLLQAPVTSIPLTASGDRVAALVTGPGITVSARHYVLACGGLENPRLLLTAGPDFTPLIDNPNVGRHFMEHFHLTWSIDLALFGQVAASSLYEQCGVIDDCCAARAFFVLADRARREHGLTNVAMKVHHDAEPHPIGEAASRLTGRLGGQPAAYRPASLSVMAEQVPNPSSGVTVGAERDALGVPRLKLDWRATALDNRSVPRSVELLGIGLGRAGAGRVRPLAPVRALESTIDFGGAAYGGQHHLGTTRMSATAHDGVVDAHCRVHGIENLSIAGSSVFATGGSANPTLTIMALAIRLADHLAPSLRT